MAICCGYAPTTTSRVVVPTGCTFIPPRVKLLDEVDLIQALSTGKRGNIGYLLNSHYLPTPF